MNFFILICYIVTAGKPVNVQENIDHIPTIFKFSKEENDLRKKQKEARQTRFDRRRQAAKER